MFYFFFKYIFKTNFLSFFFLDFHFIVNKLFSFIPNFLFSISLNPFYFLIFTLQSLKSLSPLHLFSLDCQFLSLTLFFPYFTQSFPYAIQ